LSSLYHGFHSICRQKNRRKKEFPTEYTGFSTGKPQAKFLFEIQKCRFASLFIEKRRKMAAFATLFLPHSVFHKSFPQLCGKPTCGLPLFFLTKTASRVALGTPQPIFLCEKEAQRKIDQKETPIREFRALRSAPRATRP